LSTTNLPGIATASRPTRIVRLDELLAHSADGDTSAFAELYAETASQAFGLALRVLRDHSLAEHAVQDAYLTIWHEAARFDSRKGTSLGWIFMIVRRTATDRVGTASPDRTTL
jgi:RNA polymerase sigma-70 factor (ECF subfamily)